MKKTLFALFVSMIAFLSAQAPVADAQTLQEGDFAYRINGSAVEITDYTGEGGTVAVPDKLGGRPVESIGESAFEGCEGIMDIAIPGGVKNIGRYAFCGCIGLDGVALPSGVTAIGDGAFEDCDRLESFAVPDGAESIGFGAFLGCERLSSIAVGQGNAKYASLDGVLFNQDRSVLIQYPEAKRGAYTVPDGVKEIGGSAFSGCAGLVSVILPGSVAKIGNGAFSGCSGLTGFIVDASNANYSSLAGVLFNGDKTVLLQYPRGRKGRYEIPEGVAAIGESAFESCGELTGVALPGSVKSIGNSAFDGCGALAGVTIPDGAAVGASAFRNCGKLAGVTFAGGAAALGEYAFSSCGKLARIDIPKGVKAIGYGTFGDCASLAGVTIPEGVTEIGSSAFYGCAKLTGVVLPRGLAKIDDYAFYDCAGLTGVTIPGSVTDIGDSAFNGCAGLTRVEIPGGVESVGVNAFGNCSALKEIAVDKGNAKYGAADGVLFSKDGKTLTQCPAGKTGGYSVPAGVTGIGDSAFSGCERLAAIAIPGGVTGVADYAFSGCKALASVAIPQGVAEMGDYAFYNCASLTGVSLPAGLKSIGNGAFSGCKALTCVTLPEGVTAVGDSAFTACTGLTSVVLPSSVTSIGASAFSGCNALTKISVGENNAQYRSSDGVLFNKSGTCLLQYPAGKAGDYAVPAGVTEIGGSAFSGCGGLSGVLLPDGLKKIGAGAFSSCQALKAVSVPDSVTGIGFGAFRGCASLSRIDVGEGNARYSSADGVLFNKDKSILLKYPGGKPGSYVIPGSVKSIGYPKSYYVRFRFHPIIITPVQIQPFVMPVLPKPVIPRPIIPNIHIGSLAASGSVAGVMEMMLDHAAAASPVYTLADAANTDGAFSNCTGLTGVTIPEGIDEIYDGTFSGCTGLVCASLPESVRHIGVNAFSGCNGLKSLFFFGDAPELASGALPAKASSLTVYHVDGKSGFTAPWHGFGADVFVPEEKLAGDNAAIARAVELIPTAFTAREGTDANLLASLSAIAGMGDAGAILSLSSQNPNVAAGGDISYAASGAAGSVDVYVNRDIGAQQVKTVAVTVPAHSDHAVPAASDASAAAQPGTVWIAVAAAGAAVALSACLLIILLSVRARKRRRQA